MNAGWGAVGLGALLVAGALLRLLVRRRSPAVRAQPAHEEALRLAELCREARALASRKAWGLLDVHLVRVEEAALGLLEKLEKEGGG